MRPLIIDEELKSKISALVAYAEKNPFSMDNVLDVYNNEMAPAGDMDQYTLILPFGYKIVYSIENQPVGNVRHLSMSIDADGKLPSTVVVKIIMKMIGFENEIEDCQVKLEDYAPNQQAVNVWEVISSPLKDFRK